jgi:hypothetical protein
MKLEEEKVGVWKAGSKQKRAEWSRDQRAEYNNIGRC